MEQPIPAPTLILTKIATFPLDEGMATLSWPGDISKESFAELAAWLEVVTRRIARVAKANNGTTSTDPDTDTDTPTD